MTSYQVSQASFLTAIWKRQSVGPGISRCSKLVFKTCWGIRWKVQFNVVSNPISFPVILGSNCSINSFFTFKNLLPYPINRYRTGTVINFIRQERWPATFSRGFLLEPSEISSHVLKCLGVSQKNLCWCKPFFDCYNKFT